MGHGPRPPRISVVDCMPKKWGGYSADIFDPSMIVCSSLTPPSLG